ncbi:MAG: asparagine synthase (glutamine-hydrolyzing) [Hyphomicrobium sp.]
MCGINGIFAYHYAANSIDRVELARTRDHMASRGPDGTGEWIASDGRIGLGHRRLSIVDLSDAGAQPMASADEKLIVTFNGEIYNYRDLRVRLEDKGHIFRSNSDTEILLHLFAEKGEDMVHDLRGMFAFAIWDNERQSLLLARDPYGIKPLYYSDDGWTFCFASQVKALLAGGRISRDPDPAGRVGFFMWGNVPEPFTSFRQIRALPSGSTMVINNVGAQRPRRYKSIGEIFKAAEELGTPNPDAMPDASGVVREALLDSVRHHLVADVPIGAFLSAGIDSCALVGLMRDAGVADIQTLTIGFEEFQGTVNDEASLAASVAQFYGTRHTERMVTEQEFRADLPLILEAMDQPSVDGINTWFVSKAAHEVGLKVAISGLGGDELFGGYPSFAQLPLWTRRLRYFSNIPYMGRVLRKALRAVELERWSISPKAVGMIEFGGSYPGAYYLRRGLFMPWELEQVLDRDTIRNGLERLEAVNFVSAEIPQDLRSPFGTIATLEASIYMRNQLLRDTDWTSMAHSVEVRVPLVDHVLAGKVAPLAVHGHLGIRKQILARAPRLPVPLAVASRNKTGFSTPIEAWLPRMTERGIGADGSRRRFSGHWSRHWAKWLDADQCHMDRSDCTA